MKERRLLQARIAQRRTEIVALQGEIGIQQRLMEIQRQQLDARRQLVTGGSVSTKQVLEVETAFEQARVLLQVAEGKHAAARDALGEAEAALAESDAQAQKLWSEELAKASSELTEVRETIRKHVDRVERLIVRAPARGSVQHAAAALPGRGCASRRNDRADRADRGSVGGGGARQDGGHRRREGGQPRRAQGDRLRLQQVREDQRPGRIDFTEHVRAG